MPVKLRLQRHGKKGKPFYWLVAADSRAKRDGRYLEKIGTYNPNTNPASVDIYIDRAVNWLEKGAQPTDTARTLLSYKGAMLKHHLNGGVRKGAITQEEADKKFDTWIKEKEEKIHAKKDSLSQADKESAKKRIKAEKEASEKRLADAKAKEETKVEIPTEETSAAEEAPNAEETPADEKEVPAAEETPAAEEEAPAAEETPAAEEEAPAAEETPADEKEAPAAEEATTADEKEAPAAEEEAPAAEEEAAPDSEQ